MALDSNASTVMSNHSFAGVDVKIMIAMPDGDGKKPIFQVLQNVQTISYSIFREKGPVRSLGFIGEKGKSRGTRTIAGSIVFTVFDRHPLLDLMIANSGDPSNSTSVPLDSNSQGYTMADQLPPFDIILHFANEYGFTAELILMGVEIMSEGQVQSVQDIITENTMQYTARHAVIMRPGGYQAAADQAEKDVDEGTFSGISNFLGLKKSSKTNNFESIMNAKGGNALNRYIERSHNPFR